MGRFGWRGRVFGLIWLATVLGMGAICQAQESSVDEMVRLSQEMVRAAYNFGYQYGGCDQKLAGGKVSEQLTRSLSLYGNICEEGVKDNQAGKAANPEQAGVSVAEQLAVLAYREKKHAEARKWFEVAAQAGRLKAHLVLASMCRDGGGGPKECDKAVYWLQKAGEGGSGEAWYELGRMYHEGNCVKLDYGKAAGAYEKAIDQSYAPAWTNMGVMLINGQGYEPNPPAAYVYWRIGAELGDKYAAELLEKVEFTPEQRQAGEDALREMLEGK